MGAEGLELFSPDMEKHGGNAVNWHDSKMPGAQAGAIDSDSASQGQMRLQAAEQFEALWLTLRLWEAAAVGDELKVVQLLRDGLALLMSEVKSLTAESK